jgi:hypothetical protein
MSAYRADGERRDSLNEEALIPMLLSLVTVDLSLPPEKLQAKLEALLRALLRWLEPHFEKLCRSGTKMDLPASGGAFEICLEQLASMLPESENVVSDVFDSILGYVMEQGIQHSRSRCELHLQNHFTHWKGDCLIMPRRQSLRPTQCEKRRLTRRWHTCVCLAN